MPWPRRAISRTSSGCARARSPTRKKVAFASDPQVVADRIERKLSPGAIVLLHEGAKHGRNVEAVRAVLERMHARGFRAVLPD